MAAITSTQPGAKRASATRLDRVDLQGDRAHVGGTPEHPRVADHDGAGRAAGERLGDDLRPDARRVAQRDRDHRHAGIFPPSARRRASGPPKPPALVTTRSGTGPISRPATTPGSSSRSTLQAGRAQPARDGDRGVTPGEHQRGPAVGGLCRHLGQRADDPVGGFAAGGTEQADAARVERRSDAGRRARRRHCDGDARRLQPVRLGAGHRVRAAHHHERARRGGLRRRVEARAGMGVRERAGQPGRADPQHRCRVADLAHHRVEVGVRARVGDVGVDPRQQRAQVPDRGPVEELHSAVGGTPRRGERGRHHRTLAAARLQRRRDLGGDRPAQRRVDLLEQERRCGEPRRRLPHAARRLTGVRAARSRFRHHRAERGERRAVEGDRGGVAGACELDAGVGGAGQVVGDHGHAHEVIVPARRARQTG